MSKKKRRNSKLKKRKLLDVYGQQLGVFDSDLAGLFQCPTCRKIVDPRKNIGQISLAHIVPDSAGGEDVTLLCTACNSFFGRHQDLWFGEYVSVIQDPIGTFIDVKRKSKYIDINGTKVVGKVWRKPDGTVCVFTPIDLNPPGLVESLNIGSELNVSFRPEILGHENEISVGYLTCAYLKWFKAIGYNWVFQSSLENFRKQILSPKHRIIEDEYLFELGGDDLHEPAIVLIPWGGRIYPGCVVFDRLVVFPQPFGGRDPIPFVRRRGDPSEIRMVTVVLDIVDRPYGVIYGDQPVVVPDLLQSDGGLPDFFLHLPVNEERPAEWLKRDMVPRPP